MKTPTWKIVVYLQLYQHHPGKHKSTIVEAHTGMEAEVIALEKFPGSKVVRTERISGYGES